MTLYKLKGVHIGYSEKFKREVLVVPLVWRWIDWKYDKFIPMREAINIVADAVIRPDDKYLVMSKKDKKKEKKSCVEAYKEAYKEVYREKPVSAVSKNKKRSLEDFPTHISLF